MKKLIFYLLLVVPFPTFAAIDLPWESTYNCHEWTNYVDPLNCDGFSKGLNVAHGEGIIAAANHPGGGGGKGQRHYFNPGSGGLKIHFNTPQTHIWVRWYMKFSAGWTGTWHSFKVLYLWDSEKNPGYVQLGYPGMGGARLFGGGRHAPSQACKYCGFDIAFGVDEWALHEVEIDITGGVARWWINEQLIIDAVNMSWNSLDDVKTILIGSNIKELNHPEYPVWVDFDDFKISNTGYIGP